MSRGTGIKYLDYSRVDVKEMEAAHEMHQHLLTEFAEQESTIKALQKKEAEVSALSGLMNVAERCATVREACGDAGGRGPERRGCCGV